MQIIFYNKYLVLKLMSSLFHQKTPIPINFKNYHSNGTGRDSYIAINNGG